VGKSKRKDLTNESYFKEKGRVYVGGKVDEGTFLFDGRNNSPVTDNAIPAMIKTIPTF
jgi:hypothetical protein